MTDALADVVGDLLGSADRGGVLVLMMALIAPLPWAHARRPRRATMAVSLLGSVSPALSGFLFSIDHM